MRVLLTDGSGLTARQVATHLSRAGHTVEALSPDPLALTRFTRHVRRVHRVPPYGIDPFAWLEAAIARFQSDDFDVLFPTQEQVAVLSAQADRVRAAGVATAVPSFESLARLQDKCAAHTTLAELALPQPDAAVVGGAVELAAWRRMPVFVKRPIGTATAGVHYVSDPAELGPLAANWEADGTFADGGVLVQSPVAGQLAMIQAVYCRGQLVASHANLRLREGVSGGASHKRSVDLPDVREHLGMIGDHLGWHGALSLDAILTAEGPAYIDINPRLVEPGNAWRSGVDLVTALLDIACGTDPPPQPTGRPGVATHQLLLAVLGAAQRHRTRRAVLSELVSALFHRDDYSGSVEELTPVRHDLRTAIPVVVAALATAASPPSWRWFSSGAVTNYALTPAGWREIVCRHQQPSTPHQTNPSSPRVGRE